MSQREGAPQSCWSATLLRVMSWLMCDSEYHNEWGTVWNYRSEYHHEMAPETVGLYKQRIRRQGWGSVETSETAIAIESRCEKK